MGVPCGAILGAFGGVNLPMEVLFERTELFEARLLGRNLGREDGIHFRAPMVLELPAVWNEVDGGRGRRGPVCFEGAKHQAEAEALLLEQNADHVDGGVRKDGLLAAVRRKGPLLEEGIQRGRLAGGIREHCWMSWRNVKSGLGRWALADFKRGLEELVDLLLSETVLEPCFVIGESGGEGLRVEDLELLSRPRVCGEAGRQRESTGCTCRGTDGDVRNVVE